MEDLTFYHSYIIRLGLVLSFCYLNLCEKQTHSICIFLSLYCCKRIKPIQFSKFLSISLISLPMLFYLSNTLLILFTHFNLIQNYKQYLNLMEAINSDLFAPAVIFFFLKKLFLGTVAFGFFIGGIYFASYLFSLYRLPR